MSHAGWIRLAVVVGAVCLLELACRTGLIDHNVVIAPSEMVVALGQLLWSGEINSDIVHTLVVVAIAAAASIIAGFFLGLAIHALPRLRRVLDPLFATYYAVPIFAFYPVMIAIFGLSSIPIVLMGFASGCVAVIIAVLNGLDAVPPVMLKVARIHHMNALATATLLKLPAVAPHLFTGIKLAVSYAFIVVVASEFILSPSGLGHDIAFAYSDFDNDKMYAEMLFLLLIATAINMTLHWWDQRWTRRYARPS
jgi:NitT/TauT family transport system permease protein